MPEPQSDAMSVKSIESLLSQLELSLKQHGLWCPVAPDDDALTSTAPFACDTLAFEQWLQFIFLPRFRQLLADGKPLPRHMALLPLAEELWGSSKALEALVQLFKDLDEVVNERQ